jgi:hypothetical protein
VQDRNFDVIATLRETWDLVDGAKWALWAPLLALFIVYFLGAMTIGLAIDTVSYDNKLSLIIHILVATLATMGLLYLFMGLLCGVTKTAIERARGNAQFSEMGFKSFSRVLPTTLTGLLLLVFLVPQNLIPLIPGLHPHHNLFTVLIVLVLQMTYGILVGPFLILPVPLAVDKTNSPVKAIMLGIKTAWPYWSKIVGIFLVIYAAFLILMIPLGLGMHFHIPGAFPLSTILLVVFYVWVMPFMFLLQGVIYHKLID